MASRMLRDADGKVKGRKTGSALCGPILEYSKVTRPSCRSGLGSRRCLASRVASRSSHATAPVTTPLRHVSRPRLILPIITEVPRPGAAAGGRIT